MEKPKIPKKQPHKFDKDEWKRINDTWGDDSLEAQEEGKRASFTAEEWERLNETWSPRKPKRRKSKMQAMPEE